MSELRVSTQELLAAELGKENPFPVFRDHANAGYPMKPDDSVSEEDRRYIGWNVGYRVLPYRLQDGYDRNKKPAQFRTLVLENEYLRATFWPHLGGRLMSLFDKEASRELLESNPVFQPANLALRNAWFSGGIEWNSSHPGHHYLTCSPVYAARVEGPSGEPILRFYEWDRIKCFPWQMDFYLPAGSRFLFSRVRMINPHEHELPMYWWTNMALPLCKGHRVVVPTDEAIYMPAPFTLSYTQIPHVDGLDVSYPLDIKKAWEVFFKISKEQRRWIASLDTDGTGWVQTSTDRLKGRKLFVWGDSEGGWRWQEYLSQPGRGYIELQAGLARTQAENVPMPGKTEWTWTEAFGRLSADGNIVHNRDWSTAWRGVDQALERVLPRREVERIDGELAAVAKRQPTEILQQGSGWGALELYRCGAQGKPATIPPEFVFPESSMAAEQQPWVRLIHEGQLPAQDISREPASWMIQPEYEPLLTDSIRNDNEHRSDWLAWVHLGNMRYERNEIEGAKQAWEASIRCRASMWAYRNLAAAAVMDKDFAMAGEYYVKAWAIGPISSHLAVEYLQCMKERKEYAGMKAFVAQLPADMVSHERVQIFSAVAAIELDELDGVESLFEREFVTIREGEETLNSVWNRYQVKKLSKAENRPIDEVLLRRVRKELPPPRNINYQMFAEKDL